MPPSRNEPLQSTLVLPMQGNADLTSLSVDGNGVTGNSEWGIEGASVPCFSGEEVRLPMSSEQVSDVATANVLH